MSLDISSLLNKDEDRNAFRKPPAPMASPSRRDYWSNILNKEHIRNKELVEPRMEPLPSQPLQTASHHINISPRPRAIEPRAGENWGPYGIDDIVFERIPASRSKRNKRMQQAYGRNNSRTTAKKRGSFNEEKRKETGNTRKNKACFRCRNQQIRCVPDYSDPTGWCIGCKNVRDNPSKKIIHKLPCHRVKITASVLFRSSLRGGTITSPKRWEMPSTSACGKSNDQTIRITFGLCDEPIVLKVSQSKPVKVEAAGESAEDNSSPKLRRELPSYDLVDTKRTAEWLEAYFERHAFNQRTLERVLRDSHPLIQETYLQALSHCQRLTQSTPENKTDHQKLMKTLFKLWFAMRHTIGSSWICGEEELGIGTRIPDSEKTFTPVPIATQLENLNLLHVLTPLRTQILQQLEGMLVRNKAEDWYTVYLVVFILMHEVSVATRDQTDAAMAKSSNTRYSSPEFVQELHESANTIILHWHYWLRNADPLEILNSRGHHHDSPLRDLSDDEFEFVVNSYKILQGVPEKIEALPVEERWEHELFWISQMPGPWKEFVGFLTPSTQGRRNSGGSLSSEPTIKSEYKMEF